MDTSKAQALLERAAPEPDRIRRHLMVAAAIGHILSSDPIVVGGLAEDFYTDDRYTPTDLDLCAPLTARDRDRLRQLGFERDGRHWFHPLTRVAVEFPDEKIDGDESRVETLEIDGGVVRLIGLDDLYLDRLRQATMTESEADIAFIGAVAIAAARFEHLDWKYIRARIGDIRTSEPMIGESMNRLDVRIRRKARKAISG